MGIRCCVARENFDEGGKNGNHDSGGYEYCTCSCMKREDGLRNFHLESPRGGPNDRPLSYRDMNKSPRASPPPLQQAMKTTDDAPAKEAAADSGEQIVDGFEKRLQDHMSEGHPDVELQSTPGGWFSGPEESYVFNQGFALVRHGDRLDEALGENIWATHSEAKKYPNDTPLSKDGLQHARALGDKLLMTKTNFKVIISSPYYRCAQTACCIAEKLKIPIHFDQDIGEVFDERTMGEQCKGDPPYRPVDVLDANLKAQFPDVILCRDGEGHVHIEGELAKFPEAFDVACVRFACVVEKLLKDSVAHLSSIIIVTHGDALAAVLAMLRTQWRMEQIPYCSYFTAARKVKVMNKKTKERYPDDSIYADSHQWKIQMSEEIEYRLDRATDAEHMKAASLVRINQEKSKFDADTHKISLFDVVDKVSNGLVDERHAQPKGLWQRAHKLVRASCKDAKFENGHRTWTVTQDEK